MRRILAVTAIAVMAAAGARAADDEFVPEASVDEIPAAARGAPLDCARFEEPELRAICGRTNDGEVLAGVALAQGLIAGAGGGRDLPGAVALLRRAARFGSPDAALILGALHDSGEGVAADPAEAARYYRFAARAGRPAADFALAMLYEGGRGVAQDFAAAARHYRVAADAGHGMAQLFLGRLYRGGRGVAADEALANERFRQAAETLSELAEAGSAEARFLMGTMYLAGEGVPQDPHQAAEELAQAVDQGSREAASVLGDLYDDGRGVERDREEAFRYWDMALERDDAPADDLNRVAWRLAEQRRDLDRALRWARRAVALAPQDGNIRDTLAWILFHQGTIEEAMREQEQAVRQLPECWECADHLGDMYAAAGRADDARAQWERALALLERTQDALLEHPRERLRERVARKLGR